jgi:peptidoglycan/LPS O-acetylase OafA/YrhL
MRLSHVTEGRDNNFNIIRIVAALAVLISHSFNLATGVWDAEPLVRRLGMSPASIAVDAFFVISGFLVTGSLLSRSSLPEFLLARVLRIFPALLIMVILTVFGLGLFFTNVHWTAYLQDPRVWKHLIKNASLFTGVAFGLPGVFESNPFKSVVNGSLWTLTSEVHMYAMLAILWVTVRAIPGLGQKTFRPAIVSLACAAAAAHIGGHFLSVPAGPSTGFLFMFLTGSAYYLLREHVLLSRPLFWVSIVLLALCTTDKDAFFVVYSVIMGYVVLFLAYVPAGRIRKYNLVGDYSYGIYIYAFPVQQSVVALIPGISISSLAVISAAITLTFAGLSWHLLEEPALGLKSVCIEVVKRLLGIGVPGAPTRTRE